MERERGQRMTMDRDGNVPTLGWTGHCGVALLIFPPCCRWSDKLPVGAYKQLNMSRCGGGGGGGKGKGIVRLSVRRSFVPVFLQLRHRSVMGIIRYLYIRLDRALE